MKVEDNFIVAPGEVKKGKPDEFLMMYDYYDVKGKKITEDKIEVLVRVGENCKIYGTWEIGTRAVVSGYYDQILIIGSNKSNGNGRRGKIYPVIDAERVRYYPNNSVSSKSIVASMVKV